MTVFELQIVDAIINRSTNLPTTTVKAFFIYVISFPIFNLLLYPSVPFLIDGWGSNRGKVVFTS